MRIAQHTNVREMKDAEDSVNELRNAVNKNAGAAEYSRTESDLPSASEAEGRFYYVEQGMSSGKVLIFSNGTSWLEII